MSITLASALVPEDWASDHERVVIIALTASVLLTVWLAFAGTANDNPADLGRDPQIVFGEIPGEPPGFVQREQTVTLSAVFDSGETIATVSALTGERGTGKTQVAAQYAREAAAAGIQLVAWLTASGEGRLLSELAELADRLGVADPEGNPERSAGRLRDCLASRSLPAVLVFDNAEDPDAVRRWRPVTGATRIVITSTQHAFSSLGSDILVGLFSETQAIAYLGKRTELHDSDGAKKVAEELGYLPLALAQAAAVILSQQLSYLDYLDQFHRLPLDEILPRNRGDSYPDGTARAILLSVKAAIAQDRSGLTRETLRAVSCLDEAGVSRQTLGSFLNLRAAHGGDLNRTLGDLADASLIGWTDERDAIVMHRLVARAIRDQLQATAELDTTVDVTAASLEVLLPATQEAWAQRTRANEIVEHTATLFENTVSAASRGAVSRETLSRCARLANRSVRHLDETAQLARSIEIGAAVLGGTQRFLGDDHPDTLESSDTLASAFESAGAFDTAIPLFEHTLASCERIFGTDHPNTLTSRNNLAKAHYSVGDLAEAIPLFERTLTDSERIRGPDHPATLTSRNNLASAYETAGAFDKAIPLYEQTCADFERIRRADHPNALISRNNLAGAYRSAGAFDKAIPLFEQILADFERIRGTDHPDTLISRNNLAGAYLTAGSLDKAIPMLEQTLTDCERILGADHPNTLVILNTLAGAYESAGAYDKAIQLLKRTGADRERILGSDHPDTLISRNNLATAYFSIGDLGEAIPLLEQILADSERILGPDHPNILTSRNNLASAYEAAGAFDKAIPLFEETVADSERVLGPDHPNTLIRRSNLAKAHVSMGDIDSAIRLFEETLVDSERILGPDHPNTLTCRNNIAGAYLLSGYRDKAIPLFEQTLATFERTHGCNHPLTISARSNLRIAQS
jgi:tetratricopeptide (TPR) repeat protein